MSAPPLLSIVILSWNTRDLLVRCLECVRAVDPELSREVIVVDNASSDDSVACVRERFPEVRLIENPRNVGYAEGNNVGIRAARGRFVFLLNSDTEVAPDAPTRLVRFLEDDPWVGAVGAQLFNVDGSIQRACMRFPTLAVAVGFDTWFGKRWPLRRVIDQYFCSDFDHLSTRRVDQPPGAALMLRKSALAEVGLLDADLFLFFNDVELCRRLVARGFSIWFLAGARVVHHGGASTRRYGDFALEWHKNRARYYQRAYGPFGFVLAKLMTAWRATEEWWRTARRMTAPAERAAATAAIRRVVDEVWRDSGRHDPRVR
jgi:N-acetylglucosaminyl-diphospho-decaprenol L-rhamnosyltransferase